MLWVVMVAKSWRSFEFITSLPFPAEMQEPAPDQPQWFLPVFATRAAAEAWAGGRYQVMALQSVGKEE